MQFAKRALFVKKILSHPVSAMIRTALPVSLAIFATTASGQSESKRGDWTFYDFQDGKAKMAEAFVESSASDKLQKQCSTTISACVWSIAPKDFTCKQGDEFAILANSNIGALAFTTSCFPSANGTSKRLLILGQIGAIDAMAQAGTFAFAIPSLPSHRFRIAVFSGDGASVALQKLSEFVSENGLTDSAQRSTR